VHGDNMNNELKYSENKLIEEGIEGHMEERKYTPDKSITEIIEDLNYLYDTFNNLKRTASISRSASLLDEYIYKYFEDATLSAVSYIVDSLEEAGLYTPDGMPGKLYYALKLTKAKKLNAADDNIKGDSQSICMELVHIIAAVMNARDDSYILAPRDFKNRNHPAYFLSREMYELLRYSNMKFFKIHNVKPAHDDLSNNRIESTWSVTISYYKRPDLKLNIAYFTKDDAGHNIYRLKYTLEKNGAVLASAMRVLPADTHELIVCIAYTIATLLEIDEETTADILQFFG